jgi:hypothetical protein
MFRKMSQQCEGLKDPSIPHSGCFHRNVGFFHQVWPTGKLVGIVKSIRLTARLLGNGSSAGLSYNHLLKIPPSEYWTLDMSYEGVLNVEEEEKKKLPIFSNYFLPSPVTAPRQRALIDNALFCRNASEIPFIRSLFLSFTPTAELC